MIYFETVNDFICSRADYKTLTSKKTGKTYDVVQCEFRNMNTELSNITIFADKEGWLPKLKEGETYKVKASRYFSKKSNSEADYVEVIQDKE